MVHGRTIAAAAFAAAFGLGAAPGPGSPVSSLQGVPAFRVVVEQLGPAAERAGVRRETLQVDVETALARAGIKSSAAADAILYVNVSVACAFNVAVEAQQKVRLDSRPEAPPFVAATWSGGVTGVAGTKAGIVRRTVREQVGRFTAAWREANPGK